MGWPVCPTAPGIPPAWASYRLGKDAQRQIEGDAPVRLVDDLADPQVPGEAAQDVGVLATQPVVGDQPFDGVPHRVAGVLHEVGSQRAHRVITGRIAAWLQGRRRRYKVVAPGPRRPALDHSKPE